MENENRAQVTRAATVVMAAILVSRILGFLRERAVAEVFGRTATTDAFFAAFALPDLMYQLLVGGALSSAFIPVFTEYLAKDEEKEAWYVASVFLNATFLILLGIMVLGVIFTPVLAPLVGVGFAGEHKELLVLLMRVTFPAVFFTALAGLCMGVLHSYKTFFRPALGPIIYNLCQILGAYILGPLMGIMAMAVGTVVGAVGNFSVQIPEVWRRGAKYYRPVLDLKHPGIRRMVELMLPAILGLSIAQINVIISQNLASTLEEGSIVALRLANRLINFPLGIFAMGISTAVFPTLAGLAAKNERQEFMRTLSFGLRIVAFITIPSAVGMAFLRVPIVRLLFESGEFTAADTMATAFALLFYVPGLFAQAALQVTTRGFYSLQDTKTPVKIGFWTVVVNLLLSIAFLKWTDLGAGGLALAFSLSSIVNVVLAFIILGRRLPGLLSGELLTTVVKSSAASVVMGLAAWASASMLARYLPMARKLAQTVQTLGSIGVGVLVYMVLTVILRMEEIKFVWDLIKRKAAGRRAKGQEQRS
ncbi:murein biosynthesis integral membrane protein MurJ [Candidatus Darwinibacter acetoxidans]|nr:murein biosynthesis integral membrane protein MurJ [Bacillota bacterium]